MIGEKGVNTIHQFSEEKESLSKKAEGIITWPSASGLCKIIIANIENEQDENCYIVEGTQ